MQIKKKKNLFLMPLVLLTVLIVTFGAPISVYADSYSYNLWDDSVPAPDAYAYLESITAADLGIEDANGLSGLSSVFYRNGRVYIAVTGKIIVTNELFETQFIISDYTDSDGNQTSVSSPQCVYVTKEDEIYITEQDLGKIVEFDSEGNYVRTLGDPQITGLDVKYAPTKVVVDDYGRIYVKAKNVYEGIIELDPDGVYNSYYGAVEVSPSLTERLQRMIATEEQLSRMTLWLPTSYSDISMDKDGYLLASVNELSSTEPIKRLNAEGSNIFGVYEYLQIPLGDYVGDASLSAITSISAADDGRFGVLDANYSRVFVYSEDGLLAYVLGGAGQVFGTLRSPVDIAFMDNKILIADITNNSIEVFIATEYGDLINEALYYQGQYDYETAATYWAQAYDINPNSVLINMGLGRYELRQEDYEGAMTYFEASGDRDNYSAAYERVRESWMEQNIGKVIVAIIIIVIVIVILKKVTRRLQEEGKLENNKIVRGLRWLRYNAFTWPGYVLSSPFKAFDEVKYEDKGSTAFCVVILIFYAWVTLFKAKYTGFLVNTEDTTKLNVPLILISSVFPYIIFIVGNWAIGTLIDGKGNMRNIFKVNMYALYPGMYLTVIGTLLSRVIILEESTFVTFLFYFPMVLYVFYCFIGLLMVHQFSFSKGIFSILLSFVAMAIVIFILALLLTLISSFVNNIGTIWSEILLYI